MAVSGLVGESAGDGAGSIAGKLSGGPLVAAAGPEVAMAAAKLGGGFAPAESCGSAAYAKTTNATITNARAATRVRSQPKVRLFRACLAVPES